MAVPTFRVSFDVPTLTRDLGSSDPLALVLRAHLYIEGALIKRIEEALTRPDAIDVARMQFPTKLSLAIALGKLESTEKTAFLQLNRIRNRFAHNLRTELVEKDEQELYGSFSLVQRRLADSLREGKNLPFLGRLRVDLITLITEAEDPVNCMAFGNDSGLQKTAKY